MAETPGTCLGPSKIVWPWERAEWIAKQIAESPDKDPYIVTVAMLLAAATPHAKKTEAERAREVRKGKKGVQIRHGREKQW